MLPDGPRARNRRRQSNQSAASASDLISLAEQLRVQNHFGMPDQGKKQ